MAIELLERHHFLLRRLHSLTGVIPIGVFMMVHLTTNASIVWGLAANKHPDVHGGVATFQHEVDFIHSLPFLILIEVFGLWLPIAFHSVLGFYYATTGKTNNARYGYQANWRYTLQRISGYVGVLFLFYHVATLRWGWTWLMPGGAKWSAEHAASTTAMALRGVSEEAMASGDAAITMGGIIVSLFYMAGVSLLVFHLANGLWTAAITWGVTVSAGAQRRWGYACAGLGAAMMALAWAAVIGFATLDPVEARADEQTLKIEKIEATELMASDPAESDSVHASTSNPPTHGEHDGR